MESLGTDPSHVVDHFWSGGSRRRHTIGLLVIHMDSPAARTGNTQDAFFPRGVSGRMPTIVSGRGVVLTDDHGRELLDVCAGPFLASLGQGNERVIAAMAEQARTLSYVYSRMTRSDANAAFSARLSAMLGPGWDRVHLTSGGSEANEMAIKMVRTRAIARGERQRSVVVTLMPAYHGATVFTLGCNGDDGAHGMWGPLTVEAEHIPAPLTFRAPSPRSCCCGELGRARADGRPARAGTTARRAGRADRRAVERCQRPRPELRPRTATGVR